MKRITLWLMQYNLKVAIKKQKTIENTIVQFAYENMIKNYKDTIMYLEAEIKSEKRSSKLFDFKYFINLKF